MELVLSAGSILTLCFWPPATLFCLTWLVCSLWNLCYLRAHIDLVVDCYALGPGRTWDKIGTSLFWASKKLSDSCHQLTTPSATYLSLRGQKLVHGDKSLKKPSSCLNAGLFTNNKQKLFFLWQKCQSVQWSLKICSLHILLSSLMNTNSSGCRPNISVIWEKEPSPR